jgi:uncharacterized protein (TIGR03546 family)
MIFLQLLGKLVKALRSEAAPGQLAGGFILGIIIGLTPFLSLHNLVIVLLVAVLRVNVAMFMFSFLLFSAIAFFFDPYFHDLGFFIPTLESMQGTYTAMYNIPWIALSNFNNTVVMGSLIVGLILMVPMFPLSKRFVLYYRETLEPRLLKLKIIQAIKGSKFYIWYTKIAEFGG